MTLREHGAEAMQRPAGAPRGLVVIDRDPHQAFSKSGIFSIALARTAMPAKSQKTIESGVFSHEWRNWPSTSMAPAVIATESVSTLGHLSRTLKNSRSGRTNARATSVRYTAMP